MCLYLMPPELHCKQEKQRLDAGIPSGLVDLGGVVEGLKDVRGRELPNLPPAGGIGVDDDETGGGGGCMGVLAKEGEDEEL